MRTPAAHDADRSGRLLSKRALVGGTSLDYARSQETAMRCSLESKIMKKFGKVATLVAMLVGAPSFSSPLRAETGQLNIVFTKGGFIVGVAGGVGEMIFRGKRYAFTASGTEVGFSIGSSTTRFVGRALNLTEPASIEGAYSAVAAGGEAAKGGRVQLQNANGVVLELSTKVGPRVWPVVGGVVVQLK
jgi:hypothetical protein